MPDYVLANYGSLWLVYPQNDTATIWVKEHVAEPMYWGSALVVEPRYLQALVEGMAEEGLSVE